MVLYTVLHDRPTAVPGRPARLRPRRVGPAAPQVGPAHFALAIYETTGLMDSCEKPAIPAGIQEDTAVIKSGQRESLSPEERRDAQMREEHDRMM